MTVFKKIDKREMGSCVVSLSAVFLRGMKVDSHIPATPAVRGRTATKMTWGGGGLHPGKNMVSLSLGKFLHSERTGPQYVL